MVVDPGDDVAVTGEHLRVPAEMPAVHMRRMRPAVDRMQQRPFLPRIEFRRIRDPHLHGLAMPALDRRPRALRPWRGGRATRDSRIRWRVRRRRPRGTRTVRADARRTRDRTASTEPSRDCVNPPTVPPGTTRSGTDASSGRRAMPIRPWLSSVNTARGCRASTRRGWSRDRASAPSRASVRRACSEQHEMALIIERALRVVGVEDERATVRRIARMGVRGVRAGRRARASCANERSTATMSVWFIILGSAARSTVSAISRPSGAMS